MSEASSAGAQFRMNNQTIFLQVNVFGAEFARSGLLRVDWALSGDAQMAVNLVVSFPGQAPVVLPIPAAQTQGWFAVHSHLLPDGWNRLTVGIAEPNGCILHERSQMFRVSNPSALAASVRQSLLARHVPVAFIGDCDAGMYDYGDPALTAWFDRPDAKDTIARWETQARITGHEASLLRDFVSRGFIVASGLIPKDLIRRTNQAIDDAIAKKCQGYEYGSSQRIEGLHEQYPAIRELWLYPAVLRLLELVFQQQPVPCQTLAFVFGSEQAAHQDTLHLTSFPAGYMCGVWVALQDVVADSGELEVYVGSHRFPRTYIGKLGCAKVRGDWSELFGKTRRRYQEMLDQAGLEKMVYRPHSGDVLIWHENLMHGGGPRRDPSLSRRSIVSHVFADGSIVYYDSTGRIGITEPVERLAVPASAP